MVAKLLTFDFAAHNKRKRSRRKYWLDKYKISKGCELCGYNAHAVALDFDHIDPTTKLFNPSSSEMTNNLKRFFVEVRKCRLICSNCHRVETMNNNHYYKGKK